MKRQSVADKILQIELPEHEARDGYDVEVSQGADVVLLRNPGESCGGEGAFDYQHPGGSGKLGFVSGNLTISRAKR